MSNFTHYDSITAIAGSAPQVETMQQNTVRQTLVINSNVALDANADAQAWRANRDLVLPPTVEVNEAAFEDE